MLRVAAAVFGIFVANVVTGAFRGQSFLPDIAEMLVLFAACGLFVAGVLMRERARAAEAIDKGHSPDRGGEAA
ncbi:MAG: hypothetical protein RQ752_04825 [Thermohalobaculum sp.]|nr:hypothetical protein [Thermohalobaculum sp.]